jgi:hypothetical protein
VPPADTPYRLASSAAVERETTAFEIGGSAIGDPDTFSVIAGPCAVESRDQTLAVAGAVHAAGASMLRGGAYKPRTSPFAFRGLGREGLEILAEAREMTGLPIVTELLDVQDVEDVAEHADVIQIGARNMQNFNLLDARRPRVARPEPAHPRAQRRRRGVRRRRRAGQGAHPRRRRLPGRAQPALERPGDHRRPLHLPRAAQHQPRPAHVLLHHDQCGTGDRGGAALQALRDRPAVVAGGVVAVFLIFVAVSVPSIKEIGLGLAVAIALDATLVRLILVPATMEVLGKWNWWLPRPLERVMSRTPLEAKPMQLRRGHPTHS